MSRRSGQSGSIQREGKWYIVRYWKDVVGQEKRQRVYERICPVSGPGKLSASARERKAKEIIADSGVDTQEYFDKVMKQQQSAPGLTFREQAETWLEDMRNRSSDPLAPSTIATWGYAIKKWLDPNIGDIPLEAVNNKAMKELVATMAKGGLSPKSVANYSQIVKMVVASATNEEGDELYPRNWSNKLIRMPKVNKKKQRTPSFTSEVVTGIVRETEEEKYRVLFAFCASSGLRFGEALGIDLKNVSQDCSTIKIVEKAWHSAVHDFLKTESGEREVDLHPSMAKMLREYIAQETSRRANSKRQSERKCSLLFASKHGKPLHQSSVLRRKLHPVLAKLGQPKCGFHAFRRFRNTYLRNYTSTPPGILQFWMGHAGEGMSDLYDKIKENVSFRKEVAEKAGLGFEIPTKIIVIGRNGRKLEELPVEKMAANA